MKPDILIVDDEADIRMHVRGLLQDEGYQTRESHHAESAFAAISQKKPDLILLDIWLEGSSMDGLELLDKLMQMNPSIPVIMISGHGNIEMAVDAIKKGAYDFIEKPFKTEHLLHLCKRALEANQLKQENKILKKISLGPNALNGSSSAINLVKQTIERVAPTKSRVMILGEAGTGKNIVARIIHEKSTQAKGALVTFNCALIDEDIFDQEFFGTVDEYGNVIKVGAIEKASKGTLFLDEVSYLSSTSQLKLLKVLQLNTFKRVGGNEEIPINNVRIISSSHKKIEDAMEEGLFKQDLYYRLNVVPINMPALRERFDDLKELSHIFMESLSRQYGRPALTISDEVMQIMQAHYWPGNVRQLRNIIEWFLIMGDPSVSIVTIDMLPPDLQLSHAGDNGKVMAMDIEMIALPLREAREAFEREYLSSQVKRFGGNISKTASFIGMERSALHRKLKNLGLTGNDKDDNVEDIMQVTQRRSAS